MCEKLKLHMETSAEHIMGEEAVRFEREIGSDVANNQHVETINAASVAAREMELESEENGESVVQYSYVTNNEHAYLAEDRGDFRIKALAKMLDKVDEDNENPPKTDR
jgi:hypothetical protein